MVEQKRYARVAPRPISKLTIRTPEKREDALEQTKENIIFLEGEKRKAIELKETKIPERRFGRYTPQKEAIEKKKAGTEALQKIESQIKEQKEIKQKIEAERSRVEALQKEASEWEQAKSLVERKGGWALYLAKGSPIYSKVKLLVEGANLEGTTTTQVSVEQAQARAKEAELIKEYSGLTGVNFTEAQAVEARREFTNLTKEIENVSSGQITPETFIESKTPEQLEVLRQAGVIREEPVKKQEGDVEIKEEENQPNVLKLFTPSLFIPRTEYLSSPTGKIFDYFFGTFNTNQPNVLKLLIPSSLFIPRTGDIPEPLTKISESLFGNGDIPEPLTKISEYLFGNFNVFDFIFERRKIKISLKESGVVGAGFEFAKSYFYMPIEAALGEVRKGIKAYKEVEFSPKVEAILGKDLVSKNIITGLPQINLFSKSGREITGTTAGALTYFVGVTPFETALDIVGLGPIAKLSKGTRAGISLGFGALGTYTALQEDLPVEQRVAGGIIAGLGAIGVYQELSPYVKGLFSRKATKTVLGSRVFEAEIDDSLKLADNIIKSSYDDSIKITRVFDPKQPEIALIPAGGQRKFFGERFDPKLKGNIDEILKVYDTTIKFKENPELPKTEGKIKEILDVIRGGEESVSGSFSEVVLTETGSIGRLENGIFTRDLDILSANREETISKILSNVRGIEARKKFKSIEIFDPRTGKVYADIVKKSVGEGGFASLFPIRRVEGVNIVDPRARLGGKLTVLSESAVTRRGSAARKAVPDIKQLTGGELKIGAEVTGGFEKTYVEQLEFGGKEVKIGVSAIDFFKALTGDVELSKEFFGTPSFIDEPFLIRESRLQLRGLFEKPQAGVRITFKPTSSKSQALLLQEKISTGTYSPEELIKLAKQADVGDVQAELKILDIIKDIKKTTQGEFTVSAQRRGELEVRIDPTDITIEKLEKLKSIRVKGQAVEVFEAGIKRPEVDTKIDINKLTEDLPKEIKAETPTKEKNKIDNLLKESREKGFEKLPETKQEKIIIGLEKQFKGLDVRRALKPDFFVSPFGVAGILGGTRLPRISEQDLKPSTRGRKEDEKRREPQLTTRIDIFRETPRVTDLIDKPELRPDIRIETRPDIPLTERTVPRPTVTPRFFPSETNPQEEIFGVSIKRPEKPSQKKIQTFDVYVKEPKQKKFIKQKTVNLIENEADDYLAYQLDTTTARSGYIKPSKKQRIPLTTNFPKGYAEDTDYKFRDFKQLKGVKKNIIGKIEKNQYVGDTFGEIAELKEFKQKKSNKLINEVMTL